MCRFMLINAITAANTVNTAAVKKQNAVVTNPVTTMQPNVRQTNNDGGALKSYFLGGVSFGGKKKPDQIKDYINHLPFADELSPEDKRNLGNVLRKKDEETDSKVVKEKSWFRRGNKLLITGYRREDQFVPKKYVDSAYRHTLQLITDIDEEGNLKLQSERVGEEDE